LFGERIDARRDLQAALASKPPTTPGGPSLCRRCDAPLVIPPGALGVRCDHCSADNLVQIAPEWAAKAGALAADLQLGADAARKHAAEGRRRVRIAAMWRIPLVIAVVLYAGRSTVLAGNDSTFASLRSPSQYLIAVHLPNGAMKSQLWPLPACGIDPPEGAKVWASSGRWCNDPKDPKTSCDDVLVVALERGEHLRLMSDMPGPGNALLAIAGRDDNATSAAYIGYDYEPVGKATFSPTATPKSVLLDVAIKTTAWYRLDLTMQTGTVVWPCLAH
jgi:LSD1 subclass zinc finger protein